MVDEVRPNDSDCHLIEWRLITVCQQTRHLPSALSRKPKTGRSGRGFVWQ